MLYGGHVYLGLTGGIGSGKSTVATIFAGYGAFVIDADALARETLADGSPLLDSLRELFGDEVVSNGTVDRKALARIVFSDPLKRASLEELVHPEVARRVADIRADLPPHAVVIYDVPLLVEKALESQFDAVIVVHADLEVRLSRLEERGLTRTEALARIDAQSSDEERLAVGTYIIENSGTIDDLRAQCETVWKSITA